LARGVRQGPGGNEKKMTPTRGGKPAPSRVGPQCYCRDRLGSKVSYRRSENPNGVIRKSWYLDGPRA